MNILITGVCGQIGSNLSRALLEKGYQVYGIDNLLTGKLEYLHPDVSFYKADVSDDLFWRYFYLPRFDLIIHLASGKIPLARGDAQRFLYSNTKATMNVIEYAKRNNAKIIFASTADVYGKQVCLAGSTKQYFKENADCVLGQTNIPRWSYAISKLWAEHALYATEGLRFNIIRYCGGYGPFESLDPIAASVPAIFIDQALKQVPLTIRGNGTQHRCFCYIDDMIDGTIPLIESGNEFDREVFNIGNPNEEIAIIDLAEKIWKIINPSLHIQTNFVEHSELPYEEIMSRIPNIEKAKELLGFEPKVSLDEGLKRTID